MGDVAVYERMFPIIGQYLLRPWPDMPSRQMSTEPDYSIRPHIPAGLSNILRMTFNVGDPTPRMMVLGLVIQKQDTVAGLAHRLTNQFASARFPKNAAHNNMPSLAKKGYVRLIERDPTGESTRDRYEATPKGVEYFREWLCSVQLPPIVRDAMQCKLELLERQDLTALIRLVREDEKAYTAACDIARARVLREQRSRRIRQNEPVDWRVRLRGIQNKDESTLWSLMSKRLEHLGNELEK